MKLNFNFENFASAVGIVNANFTSQTGGIAKEEKVIVLYKDSDTDSFKLASRTHTACINTPVDVVVADAATASPIFIPLYAEDLLKIVSAYKNLKDSYLSAFEFDIIYDKNGLKEAFCIITESSTSTGKSQIQKYRLTLVTESIHLLQDDLKQQTEIDSDSYIAYKSEDVIPCISMLLSTISGEMSGSARARLTFKDTLGYTLPAGQGIIMTDVPELWNDMLIPKDTAMLLKLLLNSVTEFEIFKDKDTSGAVTKYRLYIRSAKFEGVIMCCTGVEKAVPYDRFSIIPKNAILLNTSTFLTALKRLQLMPIQGFLEEETDVIFNCDFSENTALISLSNVTTKQNVCCSYLTGDDTGIYNLSVPLTIIKNMVLDERVSQIVICFEKTENSTYNFTITTPEFYATSNKLPLPESKDNEDDAVKTWYSVAINITEGGRRNLWI